MNLFTFIKRYWLLIFSLMSVVFATIDLNAAELQYLANHLTIEECRRLVAAAHFKSFQEPNALDQAERKIPKEAPCIDLLHHWNSQPGEGKGETHELLERRLRQMEKYDLADWLGKTVFQQLGKDLDNGLQHGLEDNSTSDDANEQIVSLKPIIEETENPTDYNIADSILYIIIIVLCITILSLCGKFGFEAILKKCRTRKMKKKLQYELVSESSDSESEDRFDIRKLRASQVQLIKCPKKQ